ncbi:MAG TPA: hypothetical protein VME67_03750 [Mycobacterium sp.]|nr:hypothetical protein [Mycobacterium sp.]HTX94017.1 hypothetical protein [Mycobacterium sp.]
MSAEEPETEAGAANDATEVVGDDFTTRLREKADSQAETQGQAWSDDDADDGGPERHPWSVVTGQAAVLISVGAAVAAITVIVGWLMFQKDRPAPSPLPPASMAEKNTSPTAAAAPGPPPPAGSAASPTTTSSVLSTTTATTPPAVSKAGFFGEWGQHSTSVTLAPDGSAHYAVWLGVANGTSWSAPWSAMTSTTAMIVMATQLESHGDTSSQWLHRYSGEAFTFTLRPDGYATITNPAGKPITLCPMGTGFQDTQGLCGA